MKVFILVEMLAVLFLIYPYLIYPFVLKLTKRRPAPKYHDEPYQPPVYIVLCVHNAEKHIYTRIRELAFHSYKNTCLIVVDDGSTDDTGVEILQAKKGFDFQHISTRENIGKEKSQRLGTSVIPYKWDTIIIYTDIGSFLPADTVAKFVEAFQDQYVRAVSSRDVTAGGGGSYIKFEMWLRNIESQHAGLVGLSGSCFAVKMIDSPFHKPQTGYIFPYNICDYPSDFTTAMNVQRGKMIAIQADIPVIYDPATSGEFARKRRTALRGMWTVKDHPYYLKKHGKYWSWQWAFQLHSHKTMRWLGPWALLIAFPLIPVLAIYVTGRHFLLTQAAFAAATIDLIRGVRVTKWKPTKRVQ